MHSNTSGMLSSPRRWSRVNLALVPAGSFDCRGCRQGLDVNAECRRGSNGQQERSKNFLTPLFGANGAGSLSVSLARMLML